LQVQPDSPEINANLGSIYVNLKQFDQAIHYYQQALKINPKMSGVYWNLAKLYQTKGEVETSLEYWNQALELNPQLADADFNFRLANTCFKADKMLLAMQSYRRAIKQRPDYAEAYANLGHTYSRQNERLEAIAYYEKALQIDPDIHDIYRSLANNYFLQATYPQAIKYYQESLKYYPDVADTYANLGASLSHLGRLEEAISCYYQAIEIKPDWPDIYCRIGHIIKHDQLLEAVKLFEKAISYDIRHIEAHQQLCDLLCHTTNLTRARQAADRYWENCQDIAPILSAAAYLFAYFQSGLREEALAKFLDLEKYCYAHIHTMSLMEVKLIYEVLIFSIPHLRDGLAENANYYRLISQRYLQDLSKQL
ncbi:MAG: tetratricopeptide repeat protein, partial [Microcoleaceae cyanobacterium]